MIHAGPNCVPPAPRAGQPNLHAASALSYSCFCSINSERVNAAMTAKVWMPFIFVSRKLRTAFFRVRKK